MGGHLHVLHWLRSQDPPCPWDSTECENVALAYKHGDVLEWT